MSEEKRINSVSIWVDYDIDDEPDIFYSLPIECGYDISFNKTNQIIEIKLRDMSLKKYIKIPKKD